jgi:hypothetical protein
MACEIRIGTSGVRTGGSRFAVSIAEKIWRHDDSARM